MTSAYLHHYWTNPLICEVVTFNYKAFMCQVPNYPSTEKELHKLHRSPIMFSPQLHRNMSTSPKINLSRACVRIFRIYQFIRENELHYLFLVGTRMPLCKLLSRRHSSCQKETDPLPSQQDLWTSLCHGNGPQQGQPSGNSIWWGSGALHTTNPPQISHSPARKPRVKG